MQTYSFRAECQYDVFTFLARLQEKDIPNRVTVFGIDPNLPDIVVEFVTDDTSVACMMEVTKDLPDIHVIRQTLRPVTLKQNSLERDINIQ